MQSVRRDDWADEAFDGWEQLTPELEGQHVAGTALLDLMSTAIELATLAAARYRRTLEGGADDLRAVRKPDGSTVTRLDAEVSRETCERLRQQYPHHGVLSEEEAFDGTLWIVDPVDGTSNLVHGLDSVAFALAFAMDGEVQLAVVVAPVRRRCYWAIRGHGAHSDQGPLHLNDDGRALDAVLVRTGFPHARTPRSAERLGRRVAWMVQAFQSVRVTGCPVLDLCELAEGKVDIQTESMRTWDIAAAGLIAREAGAVIAHVVDGGVAPELDGSDVVVGLPRLVQEAKRLYLEHDDAEQDDIA